MSKGGMQSSAVRDQLCPICGKSVSVQIRDFHNDAVIYKHITLKGTVLYCDSIGNKRKRKLENCNE